MTTAFHRPQPRTRLACVGAVTGLAALLTFGAALPAQALPPVGGSDSYDVVQDTPLMIGAPGFLGNDMEPEGDAFEVHSIWPPAGGPLPGEEFNTLVGGGGFTYYPPTGFTGTRTWTYKLNDQSEVSDPITVTFTITAPVTPTVPVAVADAFAVTPGMPLNVPAPGLYANDYDTDGDSWSYKYVMQPVGNALPGESLDISVGYGGFVYTPPTGYTGTRTWQYSIQGDDGESSLVDIVFTIGNPAPANAAPVSTNDAYSVTSGTALTVGGSGVLANDTDADGDALSVVTTTGPVSLLPGESLMMNPDGSLVYFAPTGFVGTRTWSYVANDGTVDGAPASIVFTVTAPPNAAPVAVADAYDVVAGSTLVVTAPGLVANDTDADGDTLTPFEYVQPDVWLPGEAFAFDGAAGGFSYTPPTGYVGTRVLEYRVHDGDLPSAPATITFTIAAVPPLPTLPQEPGTPTTANTPSTGGGEGGSLASTGMEGAGLAGTAGLAGLLVAGGFLARRISRREA